MTFISRNVDKRSRYRRLRSEGLCGQCGRNPTSFSACDECKEREVAREQLEVEVAILLQRHERWLKRQGA